MKKTLFVLAALASIGIAAPALAQDKPMMDHGMRMHHGMGMHHHMMRDGMMMHRHHHHHMMHRMMRREGM